MLNYSQAVYLLTRYRAELAAVEKRWSCSHEKINFISSHEQYLATTLQNFTTRLDVVLVSIVSMCFVSYFIIRSCFCYLKQFRQQQVLKKTFNTISANKLIAKEHAKRTIALGEPAKLHKTTMQTVAVELVIAFLLLFLLLIGGIVAKIIANALMSIIIELLSGNHSKSLYEIIWEIICIAGREFSRPRTFLDHTFSLYIWQFWGVALLAPPLYLLKRTSIRLGRQIEQIIDYPSCQTLLQIIKEERYEQSITNKVVQKMIMEVNNVQCIANKVVKGDIVSVANNRIDEYNKKNLVEEQLCYIDGVHNRALNTQEESSKI